MDKELLFSKYGPCWKVGNSKSKRGISLKEFPIADGVTCGPVYVPFPEFVPPFPDEEQLNVKPKELLALEKSVRPQKKIGKFPVTTIEPCLKPLRYSYDNSGQLPNSLLSPLTYFRLDDTDRLIFGEPWKDTRVLKMATISEEPHENGNFVLSDLKNISKYSKFQEAHSAVINGIPSVLLNVDDSLNLIGVENNNFTQHSLPLDDVSNSCLSHCLRDTIAFTRKNRSVHIYNIGQNRSHWSGKIDECCNPQNTLLACEFDCHPLLLHVATEEFTLLIDGRMSPSDNSRRIFDMKVINDRVMDSEIICSLKSVPSRPYVFIMCSESVFLMDNRYCKQPVLNWQHMIVGKPSFPQLFMEEDIATLLVVDPPKSQLCLIPTQWETSDYPLITALSTPKHFNVVSDMFTFGRQNGILFNHKVEKQIDSPIGGVTIIPKKQGNLIITQNCFGSLFCMRFINRKSSLLNDPDVKRETFRSLKQFEKEMCSPHCVNYLPKDRIEVKSIERLKKRKQSYASGKSFQKAKSLDKFIWNFSVVCSNTKSDICKEYIRDEKAMETIIEDNSVINYFADKSQNVLTDEFLTKCEDPLSKSLISIWKESESQDDSMASEECNLVKQFKEKQAFKYERTPLLLPTGLQSHVAIVTGMGK